MAVPERIYESWNSTDGWDNHTQFGKQFGEDGYSWCVMFDWDMYADVGLAAVVPRLDNVSAFTEWAQKRGQWSDYPSIGAWVNFSNGAHTELVVGFDDTNVYTKGGNSVQAGSSDNGQGNGVWRHTTARRATKVVGYFAPRFPDGICPPTADPSDPRGGKAVTSWRWTGAATPTPQQEEDVALTAADIKAFWAYAAKSPVSGAVHSMETFVAYQDANFDRLTKQIAAASAAENAAIAALAKALGDAHDGVDTAALIAAVEVAVKTAATDAIKDAVVKVDVSVHDQTT
jgi:hypothetical protein